MYIANPVGTLRLIDLIDTSGFRDFDYSEIYEKTHHWLDSLKVKFYNETEWDAFIKRFCDRYYMRDFNFNTYLDFKLQLSVVLDSVRQNAENLEYLKVSDLGMLEDYRRYHTSNDTSSTNSDSTTQDSSTQATSGSSDNTHRSDSSSTQSINDSSSDTSYNLYSDTPSNTVNLDNMISKKNNYITNATNDKNTHTGTQNTDAVNTGTTTDKSTNKSNTTSTNTSTNLSNGKSNSTHTEDTKEIHGSYLDFVQKMKTISDDIINFYLDEIENAQLFSNILY